jgi:vacuolar protein sorting-associated protein 54
MLRDAEYFKARIGGLDGAGDAGDYLVNLVKEKAVPRPQSDASLDTEPAPTNGSATNGEKGDKIETKEEKSKNETFKEGVKEMEKGDTKES